MVGVIGVNGIGKSTLLRTLGRVQPKLNGKIEIGKKEIGELSTIEFATAVSMVLTEPISSKNLTVSELVSLGRQPHTNWLGSLTEEDSLTVKKVIGEMGLGTLMHKKCYELSDGQLQKVLIARALAQDTDIILLDEPTTHLDLYHKVQILKLLQQIAHQRQKTILYTTHEIDLAIQLCDKLLILDDGQNPFGTPEQLMKQGSFEKLFPSDTISFDPKTASFKVNK